MSYDYLKRLNAHTDSSVPPHGLPALCLLMHYANGTGTNTLADGFAIAEKLRKDDPEAFKLLCTYGLDAERDFVASRADSLQTLNRGLILRWQEVEEFVTQDDELMVFLENKQYESSGRMSRIS